ncbi:hypothetical protein B0H14DRAFT_2598321 [Mycena olivaceomarginata]|nr:hypothetical protein B0H14DRAFT_2598321 [Mycena olivaceomarginata]
MYATVIYGQIDTGANALLSIKKHKVISQQDLADGRGVFCYPGNLNAREMADHLISVVADITQTLELAGGHSRTRLGTVLGVQRAHNFVHESVVAGNLLAAKTRQSFADGIHCTMRSRRLDMGDNSSSWRSQAAITRSLNTDQGWSRTGVSAAADSQLSPESLHSRVLGRPSLTASGSVRRRLVVDGASFEWRVGEVPREIAFVTSERLPPPPPPPPEWKVREWSSTAAMMSGGDIHHVSPAPVISSPVRGAPDSHSGNLRQSSSLSDTVRSTTLLAEIDPTAS